MHIWTYPTKTTRSQYDINDKIGCWNIWKLGMWGLRVGQSPRDDRASHRQQQLNYFCWFLRLSISIKFFLRDCGCPCLPTLIVQNFHPLNIGLQTKIPSSIQAGTYNIHSPLLDNTQRTSTRVYRSLAATYLHLTLTAQVLGVMKLFMMFLCLKDKQRDKHFYWKIAEVHLQMIADKRQTMTVARWRRGGVIALWVKANWQRNIGISEICLSFNSHPNSHCEGRNSVMAMTMATKGYD